MATPTFLAGACFVIVATLAYGTTQTHLLYSEPCQSASCSLPDGPGGNGVTLKTKAQPGLGGKTDSVHSGGRAHQVQGSATSGPGSTATKPSGGGTTTGRTSPKPPVTIGDGQSGPRVAILFSKVKSWHGGFMAAVTIANHGRSALAGWQLWLRYRTTDIERMWGAHWFPDSQRAPNVGLVAPPSSQRQVKPGATERFTFRATGPARAPIGCSFDGYHCSFKVSAGGRQPQPPSTNSGGTGTDKRHTHRAR
jgi:Cellulose binding domain